MAETIGTAYIQIEPTTKGIEGKITSVLGGEAEKAGTAAGSKLSTALGSAAKVGGVALAGIATAFVGVTTSVINGTKATAEYGDNIDKMSQKLGVSAEFYQEWDAVLQHSGTSMDSMSATFKKLATASQSASADQEAAFNALGLSMEQVSSMSTEELFSSVITGLQGMEEGTERTALATELLGKGAMEMGALLNTSAEDTQGMIDTVHELGGVMSDEAVKNAAAFQDSLQNLQTSFGGLKNNLMAEFLPSITTVMDGLAKLASGDDSGLALLKEGIVQFLANIKAMIPDLLDIAAELLLTFVDAIVDNLPEIVEIGIEIILKLIVGIMKAVPKLIQKMPEIIKAIVTGLKNAWPELVTAGKDMVEGIWNGIKSMWSSLKSRVTNLASDLVDSVKNFFKIGSPSKLFRDEIGQWIPAGIAVGIEGNISELDESMDVMQSALDPNQLDISRTYTTDYDTTSNNDGILAMLGQYLPQLANMQIVLDSNTLVGATAPAMNTALGKISAREGYR